MTAGESRAAPPRRLRRSPATRTSARAQAPGAVRAPSLGVPTSVTPSTQVRRGKAKEIKGFLETPQGLLSSEGSRSEDHGQVLHKIWSPLSRNLSGFASALTPKPNSPRANTAMSTPGLDALAGPCRQNAGFLNCKRKLIFCPENTRSAPSRSLLHFEWE